MGTPSLSGIKLSLSLPSVMIKSLIPLLVLSLSSGSQVARTLDEFTTGTMLEDGVIAPAAPQCQGLGWVYHKGHCYLFDSVHTPYLVAEEKCNEIGGYLADVLTAEENNFIKSVLAVVNPKDGTDYWLGGLDADRNKGLQWVSGAPMRFTDFKENEPRGNPYLHMNFDAGFAWDTKDDATDKDNGFICKKTTHCINHFKRLEAIWSKIDCF